MSKEQYHQCLRESRPYFGTYLGARQGDPRRHIYMQSVVQAVAEQKGGAPIRILELGSWAGGSAITWAAALKRLNGGRGLVVCVDPWTPYFDPKSLGGNQTLHEMSGALESGEIVRLFQHNVRTTGNDDVVIAIAASATEMTQRFAAESFDIVFIDANHFYEHMRADLMYSLRLVAQNGFLCGDDLEAQMSEVDASNCRANTKQDYIQDPKSGKYHHPGVTLAVGECLGEVRSWEGFWAVRRVSSGWNTKPELDATGFLDVCNG
jgi:predicted O-methyltransferase YrrM